jgi:Protein HRI1
MFPQENGELLESGNMVNPETGKDEKYKECWVDAELSGQKVGWTLKMEEEGKRGMIIRIGRWIQGIIRRGEQVAVARWKYKNDREGTVWIREVAMGMFDHPERMFGSEKLEVGKCFEGMKGEGWEVVESFTWD